MTQPLSPAAQAVLDAAYAGNAEGDVIGAAAAALRAVVDQVVPEVVNAVGDQHDEARRDQWLRIRRRFLAIAAELEETSG